MTSIKLFIIFFRRIIIKLYILLFLDLYRIKNQFKIYQKLRSIIIIKLLFIGFNLFKKNHNLFEH
jgi:hypothetical protein